MIINVHTIMAAKKILFYMCDWEQSEGMTFAQKNI